ncbi:MAG: glycosyltransferase family 87 protein [Lachnospiraceae bacterium]
MINKLSQNKYFKNALLLILILLAAVSLFQGVRNAIHDSQDFQWDAMKVFSHRINPYDESANMNPSGILEQYGYDKYYLQMEANQFPSLLMILLVFAPLQPLTARYVWIVLNLLFTALIVFLLKKTLLKDMDNYSFCMLSLLMIAGTPYRNQLGVGQHTLFAFCFFLIALYFSEYSEKRNAFIVTIALFICYFKYTLTVPLVLYFIYKKRYKEIIVSVLMHGVLTLVGAWWLNDSIMNMILKPLLVSSKLAAEGGLDISALFSGSVIAYILAFVIMLALFISAFRMNPKYERTYMSCLILWSLIITYHRTYDFFVMITVYAMFLELEALSENSQCIMSENGINYLKIFYFITMISVFFVLRVFMESLSSRIFVGILYYILTIAVSIIVGRVRYYGKKEKAD